ncbi:MAG: hypothetical protein JWN61_3023, partial [Pseudonocardiales bacterium]|nr:hypothetical protein [Pseudonocardiales bacterium]
MTSIQERRDALRQTPPPSDPEDGAAAGRAARSGATLRLVLLGIIAVMVLGIAGAGGYLLRGNSGSSAAEPGDSSVDAGFARDMMTHHEQAVQMAITVEYASADPEVRTLAFDIETSQTFQEGQMNGWLDSWGLTRQTDQAMMAWMGDGGMDHGGMASDAATDPTGANTALMPGMATPAEIDAL